MNASLGQLKDKLEPGILNVIILKLHDFWLNILTPKSAGFFFSNINISIMQRMGP